MIEPQPGGTNIQAATDPTLGQRIVTGAGWTIALRMTMRLLGIISTVILARLLVPSDFGLIALATLVSGVIELLTTFNFKLWLIRHQSPGRDHYDTVWTLSILRALVCSLALAFLARPAAVFFDEPRLTPVVGWMALVSLIVGFSNVGTVDFQKHFRFDREFRLTFGARLTAFVVTVGLAWVWRDYRALVVGLVARALANLTLSYRMHPYRPRLSLACWREILDFSKWLLVGDLLLYLYSRADNFLLGKLASAGTLGIYTVAHEIASLASTELVMPIRRALVPGYAKMVGDRSALIRGFVDGFAIILLIGLPAAAGLGVLADPLVRVALGEQWLASIPLLQALAIYGMTSIASANLAPLLIALGHTRVLAALIGIGAVLLVPSFTWAFLRYGVVGAALSVGIIDAVALAIGFLVALQLLDLGIGPLIEKTWRIVVSTAIMAILVLTVQEGLRAAEAPASLALVVSFALGVVVYTLAELLLWYGCRQPGGPELAVMRYCRARFGW